MHTYRKVEDKFQVGYYAPDFEIHNDRPVVIGVWTVLSIHRSETAAMRRVNYLNGGATPREGENP